MFQRRAISARFRIAWLRLSLLAVLAGAAAAVTPSFSQSLTAGTKPRVAITDLDTAVMAQSSYDSFGADGVETTSVYLPPPTDFGRGVTEMLTTALIDSDRFIVVERKALQDILAEHQLVQAGALLPGSEARLGELLGAQYIVRGAITEYSHNKKGARGLARLAKGLELGGSRTTAIIGLDLRLYDTSSGQIVDSVTARGRAKSGGLSVGTSGRGLDVSSEAFSKSALGKATRQAVGQAVQELVSRARSVPWQGKVAEIETDDTGQIRIVYVSGGQAAGLQVGETLEVFRAGRPIRDPDTKVVIGRTTDDRLALCEITDVTETLALATLVEGDAFAVGDSVRLSR